MNGSSRQFLGIAVALVLGVGLYVASDGIAHGPGAYGWGGHHGMMGGSYGHHMGMGPGMMGGSMGFAHPATTAADVDRYLSDTKTQLGITTAQEAAWNSYAETVRDQATLHGDMFKIMHGVVTGTPQHLASMQSMVEQRKIAYEAFKTLYSQLDDGQKVTANQVTWSCHS
ncbi:MAG: Spy/CpxP family protein refolding chaperone [Magnetococcales bacterium]|nr:Spy/CpxP family protein refolding chaperone [Magnetococcales bacterium]